MIKKKIKLGLKYSYHLWVEVFLHREITIKYQIGKCKKEIKENRFHGSKNNYIKFLNN